MFKDLFTDHPASVDESYTEHMAMASSFGVRMLLGGLACFVHALLPFLFVQTGSGVIARLNDEMVVNRRRRCALRSDAPAELEPTR